MKTSLQIVLEKLDNVLAMWQDTSNEMDFEHTIKTLKQEVNELLKKEKQDLQIQYALGYDEGFYDGNLEQ